MAKLTMHYKIYDINTFSDLALVRATLEELHRSKKVSDIEYKSLTKQLDNFPKNHTLKK